MPAIWKNSGPEYDACCAHWDRIRAQLKNGTHVEKHPARTLADKADEMIVRCNREIAEWEEIKRRDGGLTLG